MSQYAYHFKPQKMSGDFLIPLNGLRETHPATYAEHAKKYKGRETLMEEKIPILECLWNDVLHISPMNPQIIIDTWRKEGLYEHARIPREIEVYKIPTRLILEESTICFQSFNFDFHNYDPSLEKYWKFNHAAFQEQKEVEPKQLEIWQNDFKSGRAFFWYSHTAHILAKQQIDTRKCELIVCQ
ncbi:MAG: hypothetical protein ACXWRU_12865 [Pseudobdellovibrionaceae bacterium]